MANVLMFFYLSIYDFIGYAMNALCACGQISPKDRSLIPKLSISLDFCLIKNKTALYPIEYFSKSYKNRITDLGPVLTLFIMAIPINIRPFSHG